MKEPTTSGIAFIIIDMINDFQFKHGEVLAQKALQITGPINQIKEQFKKHHLPIIYVNDHYQLWQANLNKIIDYCHNPISQPVIDAIRPSPDDYFLIKPKHSAFYGTALNTLLHQLQVQTLVISGIAGNICVLFSANDAYMRDYKLHIPGNCTASNNDHDNNNALKMMEEVLKADIHSLSSKNYNISALFPS
ncbi:nicotinamidase-related amidase [Cytobacillus horneckiae]|uniref:Cysteine hydrolase n=1 Tax=Cytobacillus horneckiae TaxID=549687 RepID=A0A2N0Z8K9_9BACI|nr:isochorismatase family cysteine hydrolase [Cytobacillus horneckiae]NRG46343.1 cysteine hydrolase [Bacillus sp. CRN 9]MBN6890024.1 cysteine hydrolase [Cytobacillus horneckiae]MCM3181240.1 cysteine hydrolase [Cytobacillus horneckiae]MEC1159260.1 cysteine hydrolase [Cytobacillus horneckiae]MED2936502.1 cysteine hydrolase [Cytobacillus horneckiae]